MFNQRKPRRFNYRSRLRDAREKESDEGLRAKWDEMRGNSVRKKSFLTSLPVLIVFLVLIFVLIYILDGYVK